MGTWKTPTTLTRLQDFDETIGSESKVLNTAKAAGALTKEEHKLLTALLDERNSYAHPSGRKVYPPAAEAFLTRIIDEVIVRFK